MKYSQPSYYHFSDPSIELVKFACDHHCFNDNDSIIDIFAGCGILGLELFERLKFKPLIDFCEIQQDSIYHLRKNINQLGLQQYNIFEYSYERLKGEYSVILANPPYFEQGEARLSDNMQKNICRHFLNGSINNFLEKSYTLLSKQGILFILRPLSSYESFKDKLYETGFKLKEEKLYRTHFLMKASKAKSCSE